MWCYVSASDCRRKRNLFLCFRCSFSLLFLLHLLCLLFLHIRYVCVCEWVLLLNECSLSLSPGEKVIFMLIITSARVWVFGLMEMLCSMLLFSFRSVLKSLCSFFFFSFSFSEIFTAKLLRATYTYRNSVCTMKWEKVIKEEERRNTTARLQDASNFAWIKDKWNKCAIIDCRPFTLLSFKQFPHPTYYYMRDFIFTFSIRYQCVSVGYSKRKERGKMKAMQK